MATLGTLYFYKPQPFLVGHSPKLYLNLWEVKLIVEVSDLELNTEHGSDLFIGCALNANFIVQKRL